MVALRLNPAKFAGRNLIKALRAQVVPASGRIGAYANSTFWGVIALRGARQTLPTHSIAYIKGRQQSNGGYSYLPTKPAGADSNDTAAAIMAMHAGGVPCSDVHIQRAIGYLSTTHIGGGGYALLPARRRRQPIDLLGGPGAAGVRAQERRRRSGGSARGTAATARTTTRRETTRPRRSSPDRCCPRPTASSIPFAEDSRQPNSQNEAATST